LAALPHLENGNRAAPPKVARILAWVIDWIDLSERRRRSSFEFAWANLVSYALALFSWIKTVPRKPEAVALQATTLRKCKLRATQLANLKYEDDKCLRLIILLQP
jgi:DNA phosphorothioation-dependent restriction protein DptG